MKIAIVGAGLTGLTAFYHLLKLKHKVVLFEKENSLGGMARSFKQSFWKYAVEKHYHHWFCNDYAAFKLIKDLGLEKYLICPKVTTAIFKNNTIYPFDSPSHVVSFTPLSLSQRLRTGVATLFLKLLPATSCLIFERFSARDGIEHLYGKDTAKILWHPLLKGKFKKYENAVNMAWFWARIKKRTRKLKYMTGGYQRLIDVIEVEIRKKGGKILLSTPFEQKYASEFDKILITTPSSIFLDMFPALPASYKKKLASIPHLHAFNLLLIAKEKFLKDTYWLNINDADFPFIGVIQHTNLVDKSYYGGQHLAWIANYLPPAHPYLKKDKEQLFEIYKPYLKKINPSFNFQLVSRLQLFCDPFAQPVFPLNYSRIKPDFKTPIPNVYLANIDMVYPWDRGTNYAIDLGKRAAKLIHVDNIS